MKILCPTDFSDHSKVAINYAVNLVNLLDAELHVVSAYFVPHKTGSFVSLRDIVRENTQEDMDQLMAGVTPLLTNQSVPPVSLIFEESATNLISKYAAQNDIDLIVMGTQGDNSISNILFGSITKKVCGKSNIPVLAIPSEVSPDLTNKRFVLALDDKEVKDSLGFDVIRKIALPLEISVDFVHIIKPGTKDKVPLDPFISSYLEGVSGNIIIEEGSDPVNRIKEYVEENNIGMLIMIRREHTFLERLLFKGHTGSELASTTIPLMIIPE